MLPAGLQALDTVIGLLVPSSLRRMARAKSSSVPPARKGPAKCSGFGMVRYDTDSLQDAFGTRFRLVESSKEMHGHPFGSMRQSCIVNTE
jgi:hypothetical protein